MITKDTPIITSDPILRKAMYLAFDGKCFYSGRFVEPEEVHIDHILPKALGGKDCIANYVFTCQELNLRKNDTYTEEFGKVVLAYYSMIFANRVVDIYNDLVLNLIEPGFIEINTYLKQIGISPADRSKYVAKAKRKFRFVKRVFPKTGYVQFYFNMNELKGWLNPSI